MAKNISAPDIRHKIINELNRAKLKYVLVGGAALVVHGFPRSTLDIDIYVSAEAEILNKLFKIADSLGLQSEQKSILAIKHFPHLFAGQWVCFSHKGEDIFDVFFAAEKEFNDLYVNSELKKDKTISIRVASLKDIEKMKKKIRRPVDLADIEIIKAAKKQK